ncbi:TRAP transporter small permease [Egibacter rhizosphaerae]|uniref:TRAP transporter small permease n=1 Tax=Egibacter rhizosphaerae TaxID=1670831 RepID=UPI0013F162E6|nr:TRAP transporter small permease subunit [Egibacter rhizosphaerae]
MFDRVLDIAGALVGFLVVFQAIAVAVNVATRFFFDFTIAAVLGLTEWSVVCMAFLGAAWLERERGHVAMDAIVDRFHGRSRVVLELLAVAVGLVASAVLAYYGTKVSYDMWVAGTHDFFRMQYLPQAYVMAVIPVGGALLFLQLLRRGWTAATSRQDRAEPGEAGDA